MEAAFTRPARIVSGSQVGIWCIFNSIQIELCFITEQHAMNNTAKCKHPLPKLKTKIVIMHLNNLHT
jgi:hypothetical protein